MVLSCAVFRCTSIETDDPKKSFFKFPCIELAKTEDGKELLTQRFKKWVLALNREEITTENVVNLRVCNLHFLTGF